MQENALVSFAQLERLADLLRAAAGDVAHRDHDALCIWKLLDRVGDDLKRFAPEDHVFRPVVPVRGIRPPVPRKRIARTAEPRWIYCRFLALGRHRGERHRSRLARAARLRDVDDYRDDPSLQRAAALEAVQPLEYCQP